MMTAVKKSILNISCDEFKAMCGKYFSDSIFKVGRYKSQVSCFVRDKEIISYCEGAYYDFSENKRVPGFILYDDSWNCVRFTNIEKEVIDFLERVQER